MASLHFRHVKLPHSAAYL